MRPPIIVVASRKGGEGKTTVAYELAHTLGAILVDFESEIISSTRKWGWMKGVNPTDRPQRILYALKNNIKPRVLTRHSPFLVPGHPNLAYLHEDLWDDPHTPVDLIKITHTISRSIQFWAEEWRAPVVIDTHPGATVLTNAALIAADFIAIPTRLNGNLAAAEELIDEYYSSGNSGAKIIIIPTFVPPTITRRMKYIEGMLSPLAEKYPDIFIHSGIPYHSRLDIWDMQKPMSEQLYKADENFTDSIIRLSNIITKGEELLDLPEE